MCVYAYKFIIEEINKPLIKSKKILKESGKVEWSKKNKKMSSK